MEKIDRRNFIRKTGAAAAAGLVAATGPWVRTGQAAKNTPSDTVNVAVIGIRSRGTQHAVSFAKVPNTRVVALCDIDERLFPQSLDELEKAGGGKARTETDIRRLLEDKSIDAVSIATCNHWHALAAIWACQAGKDVYVEKPVSHNIWEGRKIVEAARKYDRIVQVGSQNRSNQTVQQCMDFIHSDKLGDIYMVKCVIFNPRESFGRGKVAPVPAGVHYDLWVGPAAWQPFNEARFHYNWHWFWNTGGGETANNGPHYTDFARWALQKYEHPKKIQSMGGYYAFDCEQETPNTQMSVMEYADGKIVQIEVRGLYTNKEAEENMGVLFFGTEGWMKLGRGAWSTYFGRKDEPGPTSDNYNEATSGYKAHDVRAVENSPHFENFIQAVRSHKREDLTAEILEGHLSATMCHLPNIAYRLGRTVEFDSATETFPGDAEAQAMVSREYRFPYVVPENV